MAPRSKVRTQATAGGVSVATERRIVPIDAADEELAEHAKWFAQFDDAMRGLGFEPAGNYRYAPTDDHVFRAWKCATFPMYVQASRYCSACGWIDYFSASSLTTDGNYFETTTAPPILASCADLAAPFYHRIDEQDAASLVEFHRSTVREWIAATGVDALDVSPAELPQAEAYGLAHLSQVIRDGGRPPRPQPAGRPHHNRHPHATL
jgi:hypothetical protein